MNGVYVKRSHALALIATSSTAVATSGLANAQTASPPLIPLKVALVPSIVSSQVYYAADLGIFKRQGLDVSLEVMNSGMDAALSGGAVDVALGDTVSVASAHVRGLPFAYFASGVFNSPRNPGFQIVVRSDSPIRSAKDFNGETIGVNQLKGIAQLVTQAWIDGNGGDSKTVKFIEFPFFQMVTAVEQGTVNASVPGEPFLTIANDKGMRTFPLARNGVSNYSPSGWIATKAWLSENPGTAAKFAAAIREATVIANKRPLPPEAVAVLSKYTKLPASDVAHLHTLNDFTGVLGPQLLQPVIDAAVKYGYIEKSFSASELIYVPR
jgi:NitT/TauT family transport system substrate-binding protein